MSVKYEISRSQLIVAIVFCFAVIGLNFFLLIENQQLKQLTLINSKSAITVGSNVLPLSGINASGDTIEVPFDPESKTLLLVYSSSCHFCSQNAHNWREILQNGKSSQIKVVGIALGENGESFLEKHELESRFPTVNILPDKSSQVPTFDVTPQTILVNSEGKAEKVWNGVLDNQSLGEIIDSINISGL